MSDDNELGERAGIAVDPEPAAAPPPPTAGLARRPARIIDGDLARLIAQAGIGTAEVLGLTEEEVLAEPPLDDVRVVAQIDDYIRKDNAQSRRGGEYKAWEAKYPGWATWRDGVVTLKTAENPAQALRATVRREALARKRSELVRDAETYLRDKHLEWNEHEKMQRLARDLGLGDNDVEWAYSEVEARIGAFTRSGPPDMLPPPEPLAPPPAPPSSVREFRPPPGPSFDWVYPLRAIDERIGLHRIDDGIAGVAWVQRDTLASGRALMAAQQHWAAIDRRMRAIQNQNILLQRQEGHYRAVGNGPAIMQIQGQRQHLVYEHHQLEAQGQQLGLEMRRLEVEVQREEREAAEQQLLRMFLDIHEVTKTALHGGRWGDAFLLLVALERIFAQLFRQAQNPHNRMTLSTIRDANVNALNGVMSNVDARRAISDLYAGGSIPYADLLARSRGATRALEATMAEFRARTRLCLPGQALADARSESRAFAARVDAHRQDLGRLLAERRALPDDRYLREFFVVPCGTVLPEVLSRYAAEVAAMREGVGMTVNEMPESFGGDAVSLDGILSRSIAECTRVLALVEIVYTRQRFIEDMGRLKGWEDDLVTVFARLDETHASLALPSGHELQDVEAYVECTVFIAQARHMLGLAQRAFERNASVADSRFVGNLGPYLQEPATPDETVIPWCRVVATSLPALVMKAKETVEKANAVARTSVTWKTDVLGRAQSCEALAQHIHGLLPAPLAEAIATEVQGRLAKVGAKLAGAFTGAKAAERRQQNAFVDVALQKMADSAYEPAYSNESPAVSVPA